MIRVTCFALFLAGCGGDQFIGAHFDKSTPDADAMAPSTGGATSTGGVTGTGGRFQAAGGAIHGTGGSFQGTGGVFQGTGGSFQGTGGASQTGGAPGTGGVVGSGGSPGTGGVSGTGGIVSVDADACAPVTHDNGLGQTWQDCVPLGTYDLDQAMKACTAHTGDVRKCAKAPGCGSAPWVVQDTSDPSDYLWGYEGNTAGYVGEHGGCPTTKPWI
jgi:hypothetical protein